MQKVFYEDYVPRLLILVSKTFLTQTYVFLVQMLRGRIVQINDKSMKIGIQDKFGTLISKRSRSTLDFAQEGRNMQFKIAHIGNVIFFI